MNSNNIPDHLKKYIVNQNYDRYNIIDHNIWSFIMDIFAIIERVKIDPIRRIIDKKDF